MFLLLLAASSCECPRLSPLIAELHCSVLTQNGTIFRWISLSFYYRKFISANFASSCKFSSSFPLNFPVFCCSLCLWYVFDIPFRYPPEKKAQDYPQPALLLLTTADDDCRHRRAAITAAVLFSTMFRTDQFQWTSFSFSLSLYFKIFFFSFFLYSTSSSSITLTLLKIHKTFFFFFFFLKNLVILSISTPCARKKHKICLSKMFLILLILYILWQSSIFQHDVSTTSFVTTKRRGFFCLGCFVKRKAVNGSEKIKKCWGMRRQVKTDLC